MRGRGREGRAGGVTPSRVMDERQKKEGARERERLAVTPAEP